MTPQEAARWLTFAALEATRTAGGWSWRPILAADLTAGLARGLGGEIGHRAFIRLVDCADLEPPSLDDFAAAAGLNAEDAGWLLDLICDATGGSGWPVAAAVGSPRGRWPRRGCDDVIR